MINPVKKIKNTFRLLMKKEIQIESEMKYLIAGLGNIGSKYAHTRHNIGFDILDTLAKEESIIFEDARYGSIAEYKYKGRLFILLKPNTYMNLSGKAINYWLKNKKIEIENLLVINDDLAIPFGKLRLKSGGSDGGHNGLKSIQEHLGHNQFARLRFGIGDNFTQGHQMDYVLDRWTKDEEPALPERIGKAIEIIKSFGTIGVPQTMNLYNNK
jgi:PTH1 family peptidyl-tRNA hydrolase